MKYINTTKVILVLVIFANSFSNFVYAENTKGVGYYINKNFYLIPNDKNLNKKVVLITIDDGPGKMDEDFINILNKHNAKAIFFINGIRDKKFSGNIKMLHDRGFTIGNHTWSHRNLKNLKKDKIEKEIMDTTNLISKITGQKPRFFRPPYGIANNYTKDLVKKERMIFMNWSGSALDWEKNSKDEDVFIKNVMENLYDGEIILLHSHPWTTKNLDGLLTSIEKEGYEFVNPADIIE